MADFGDPYAAMATNPYMQMPQQEAPDWRMVLANAAIGLGSGISQGSSYGGGGWAAGIAPGLMMGNQLMAQQRQHAEQEQMKRWQLGMMAQEYQDKHQDRILKRQAFDAAANEFAPGMRAPAPPVAQMGPGSYDTKLSGYEGGAKNGGMVYNELGSGAGGPYQFMPSTWATVAQQHPELNLPATMPMENTPEARAVHDKAHTAFKADNARALQGAGFQPTPENLYLAHRFGAGGAVSMLRSDPNKPLGEVLPIDWQRQNPDMRGQTVGGFQRLAGERMRGVGVPYEVPPDAKPTPYSLQPDSLPNFDIPGSGVMSLNPRANPVPGWAAPVMPQPQGPTQAQFTPPPQQAANVPAQASDEPPKLVLPPKPELPAADAVRIRRALMNQTMTPAEARAAKDKIENDLWSAQKDEAKAKYQQESENYRFNRGETTKKDVWEPLSADERQKMLPGASPDAQLQINRRTGEVKPVMSARDVHREAGYRLAADGVSLEYIPGGPADPETIRRTSDVKRATAEKMIPQSVTKGMQENVDALKQIDRALTALKAKPDSVGGIGSTAASMIPGVANLQNRFGDPEGTSLRALIADIGSLKIHDRSGAAVTASEFPRLRPFIPSISDDPKTVETKLNNFRAVYDQTLRDATEYYGADNGFKPYTPATSYLDGTGAAPVADKQPTKAAEPPKAGFTKDGYRFKGGDPSQRMNWEPVK